MMKPNVSILIPLYNSEKYIVTTIENCLAQTYKNIEIIIVDDGSTDDSLKTVRSYERRYENIKVFTQENSGAPKARNLAFKKSSGEYIQYLDADDLISENKIASQMALIDKYGDEHIYSSKYMHFFNNIDDGMYIKQEIDHSFDSAQEFLISSWSGGGFVTVMGWLTHRKHIENAGPWNESLHKNQDGEFFSRVLLQVKKVIHSDDSMCYYRKTGDSSITSQFKEKTAKATLKSYSLYEENTNRIKDLKLKKALAYNYLSFLAYYYPHFPLLLKKAEESIYRLGFNFHTLETPGKLSRISKILGSNNIIRLRYILREKLGVNI